MGSAERRNELVRVLCRRRYDTVANLALEFGVSERTIRRDIEVLSLTFPIYTQCGRYEGGVYVLDSYSMERMYMSDKELALLRKISFVMKTRKDIFTPTERKLLDSMISLYSKPLSTKGKKK